MSLTVREMTLDETDMVSNYFHTSTVEHLETLGDSKDTSKRARATPGVSWRSIASAIAGCRGTRRGARRRWGLRMWIGTPTGSMVGARRGLRSNCASPSRVRERRLRAPRARS